MKEVFKVGDRVFDLVYGWGKVIHSTCPITAKFSEYTVDYYKKDLVKLSFTEYTLQGFSQERPIKLPKVGELCLVSNSPKFEDLKLGFFKEYKDGFFTAEHHSLIGTYWKYLKRIKILD